MSNEKSFVRYGCGEETKWGVLSNDDKYVFELIGDIYDEWHIGERVCLTKDLELFPPCEPKTIAGLAYNYKDLVGERDKYDEPVIFLKAVSTLISETDKVIVPPNTESIWSEVEIALVLKKPLFLATREEAAAAILGCAVANDITAKNVHGRDHHLARSKSGFTFCPVSSILRPWKPIHSYEMRTMINGRCTQNGLSSNRILGDIETLMLISSIFPLFAGDLILTGTPAGALDSVFCPGDDVCLEIEGLGRLNNTIITRH